MRRQSVSFGDSTTTFVDFNSSWYTSEEYEAMKEGLCRACKEDKIRRRNVVRSVLALQEEHKENNIKDAKGLQLMASALSRDVNNEALRRAVQDSYEAYDVYKEDLTLMAKNANDFAKKTRSSEMRRSTGEKPAYNLECLCKPTLDRIVSEGLGELDF